MRQTTSSSFHLWGRNLTDQHDVGTLLSSLYYEKQLLQPITYGISGGVKF